MQTIYEVASLLAAAHRQEDPEIQEIFVVEDPSGQEVRLLEVSSGIGTVGAIMPFGFAARPDLGVPYRSVIVLVSPEEKESLDQKELHLPETWGNPPVLRPI